VWCFWCIRSVFPVSVSGSVSARLLLGRPIPRIGIRQAYPDRKRLIAVLMYKNENNLNIYCDDICYAVLCRIAHNYMYVSLEIRRKQIINLWNMTKLTSYSAKQSFVYMRWIIYLASYKARICLDCCNRPIIHVIYTLLTSHWVIRLAETYIQSFYKIHVSRLGDLLTEYTLKQKQHM